MMSKDCKDLSVCIVDQDVIGDVTHEFGGPRVGIRLYVYTAPIVTNKVVSNVHLPRVLYAGKHHRGRGEVEHLETIVFHPASLDQHGRVDLSNIHEVDGTTLVVLEERSNNLLLHFTI